MSTKTDTSHTSLGLGLDEMTEADRNFFRRRCDRSTRLRIASQGELRGLTTQFGAERVRREADERWYVLVQRHPGTVEPGRHLFVLNRREGVDCDIDEAWAVRMLAVLGARLARDETAEVLDRVMAKARC